MPDPVQEAAEPEYECDEERKGDRLHASVKAAHGVHTCDPAGRPLGVYMCDYHSGWDDGYDEAEDVWRRDRDTWKERAEAAEAEVERLRVMIWGRARKP